MSDHVVAFPENKTIAIRCAIFSLKFTKNRLAARLPPDPLGNLSASPDPLSAIWGLLLREEEGEGTGGEKGEGRGKGEVFEGKRGKGGKRREGRKWKGLWREGAGTGTPYTYGYGGCSQYHEDSLLWLLPLHLIPISRLLTSIADDEDNR